MTEIFENSGKVKCLRGQIQTLCENIIIIMTLRGEGSKTMTLECTIVKK